MTATKTKLLNLCAAILAYGGFAGMIAKGIYIILFAPPDPTAGGAAQFGLFFVCMTLFIAGAILLVFSVLLEEHHTFRGILKHFMFKLQQRALECWREL